MKKDILILIDDVHLEGRPLDMQSDFYKKLNERIEAVKLRGDNPILICAGDISEGDNGIKWVSQFNCDIVYVCGNHEFWGHDYYEVIDNLKNLTKEDKYKHIKFLHNETVIIGNTKIIGSTLWTDLAQSWRWFPKNQVIKNFMSMADFRRIEAKKFYEKNEKVEELKLFLKKHGVDDNKIKETIDGKKFNPLVQLEENKKAHDFIEKELDNNNFDGKTIVVSHHLPVPDFWIKKQKMNSEILEASYINNEDVYKNYLKGGIKASEDILMMGFYVNTMYDFFEKNNAPNLWIHGHFHQGINGYIGKTHIVSSPVGYLKQSSELALRELDLTKENEYVINYLKVEMETFDWNDSVTDNLRSLEKIITQMEASLNVGVISTNDFKGVINAFDLEHKKNLKNLKSQLVVWFNILLGTTRPGFYSLDNYDDFYILTKIMNLEKAIFSGNKFNFPELLEFEINEFSFLSEEKFKSLNKSGQNIHFKEWIREIQRIQIQVNQLKKFLLAMLESLHKTV